MTNEDVARVISSAAARGIKLSEYEVISFLGAKELLAREPENPHASITVRHFVNYMATGVQQKSFAEFMLPEFFTDEELAEQQQRGREQRT